ncbi:hypothetical protein N7510_010987 [Penicillium lagena]|uniref:uncharacterized protein n=1 Tax=Penicillium lagena TaxID=94218 RepID=UPI0025413C3D|nr:uncharacterized protein N7510_010987 [Penicillium lagena]KAJ5601453.1 hypothetical protein N7510_010987 [Penicillium lagena]
MSPAPKSSGIVRLQRLEGGYLELPMHLFVKGASTENIRRVPSMCWLITHEPSQTKIVFDLGVRKDIENYPPAVHERLKTVILTDVQQDSITSLEQAGINPKSDVDSVIISHLHWDHIGDPSGFGPCTRFIIGPGAKTLIEGKDAYPTNKAGHFDSNALPHDRTEELPPSSEASYWTSLEPFSAVHDWFGDGSMYVVDAPGHLPGHLNLLLHTGSDKWVYLAADSTHDPSILSGSAETAIYTDPHTGLFKCAHANKEMADIHLGLVRKLKELLPVEVILAHDHSWLEANPDRFKS